MAILVDDPVDSFNPRARAGRDPGARLARLRGPVSIHAPARGATRSPSVFHSTSRSFNPRARAGRDLHESRPAIRCCMFQSTRPRGARPVTKTTPFKTVSFQSTRPRGARHTTWMRLRSTAPFQSTRPRGARQESPRFRKFMKGFNPRARAGRDDGAPGRSSDGAVSIHAPARGATACFES